MLICKIISIKIILNIDVYISENAMKGEGNMRKKLKCKKIRNLIVICIMSIMLFGTVANAGWITSLSWAVIPAGSSGGYYHTRATGVNKNESALAFVRAGIRSKNQTGWDYGPNKYGPARNLTAYSPTRAINTNPVGTGYGN